jgi:hypothetical protein
MSGNSKRVFKKTATFFRFFGVRRWRRLVGRETETEAMQLDWVGGSPVPTWP